MPTKCRFLLIGIPFLLCHDFFFQFLKIVFIFFLFLVAQGFPLLFCCLFSDYSCSRSQCPWQCIFNWKCPGSVLEGVFQAEKKYEWDMFVDKHRAVSRVNDLIVTPLQILNTLINAYLPTRFHNDLTFVYVSKQTRCWWRHHDVTPFS